MTSSDSDALIDTFERHQLQVIEWHMMDRRKFYPLALSCSLTVRASLYPLTVVKTRLQVQRQSTVYSGTFDALRKIYAGEGVAGLYKGYWVSTLHLAAGMVYVTVYEKLRVMLRPDDGSLLDDHAVRSLLAGGCASAVNQTVAVPCDVVTQYMMTLGGNLGRQTQQGRNRLATVTFVDPLNLMERLESSSELRNSKFRLAKVVCQQIWRRDGLRGFYRGYVSSLCLYVPSSAVFWFAYHEYTFRLDAAAHRLVSPGALPPLWTLQAFAAASAGVTAALITNPLDLYRARIQVQRDTYAGTLQRLWTEERWRVLTKGLSARVFAHIMFSVCIVVGYESVKRLSLHPDYRDGIRW